MTKIQEITCWVFMLVLIAGLGLPSPAAAHKVSIFAWVEGDVVHTQSKFMGGKKPKDSKVEVLDAAGNLLLEGKTDSDGKFSFNIPIKDELEIILHAGMGHQASWKIYADDFDGNGDDSSPTEMSNRDADQQNQVVKHAPGTARHALTEEEVVEIVTKLLDKKLEPVIKMLAESRQEAPSFSDIIGGIGYIIGLVGVAAYVSSRRKKDS